MGASRFWAAGDIVDIRVPVVSFVLGSDFFMDGFSRTSDIPDVKVVRRDPLDLLSTCPILSLIAS